MTATTKRLASKTHKAPLLRVGEQIIEATRFFFASVVLVYVVVLVSPQEMMTASESWVKHLQSNELTDSLVLELRPVLEENDTVQKAKTKSDVNSSHLITLSSDSSELA